jgi:hypothetical protein
MINIAGRVAGSISSRLQGMATDVIAETVSSFPFAKPKIADIPQSSFDELVSVESEENERQPPPDIPNFEPEPKMTEAQIKVKANNSADVWKEALNMIQVGANLGVEFMSLEKGDKVLVKQWDEKIAISGGNFIHVPPEYHEAKERLNTFQENLLTIKTDTVPQQIRDMLYEGFYHDYKKQAEQGTIKPYSKWEAIIQSVIIILGDGFKKLVFILITKALKKLM